MLKTLMIAMISLPILASPSVAEEGRLSSLDFARANRCLAYASLGALQNEPLDLAALGALFEATRARAFHEMKVEAETEAREIRAYGRSADTPAEVARLKSRRDRACSYFVGETTVAHN